jgi:hypothetical protein
VPRKLSLLAEVFAALEATFRRLGLGWYVFGAQAALMHGAARLTADVDVTLDAGDLDMATLLRELTPSGFEARVSDPEEFARRTRVLPLVHSKTSIPVDLVLAGPGLEAVFLGRSERRDVEGILVPVARAEDLIAMKILAGRPKDLEDVAAIVAAADDRLDLDLVRETLAMLEEALSQRDLLPRLAAVLSQSRRG